MHYGKVKYTSRVKVIDAVDSTFDVIEIISGSELPDITGQSSHQLENLQKIIITNDGCRL